MGTGSGIAYHPKHELLAATVYWAWQLGSGMRQAPSGPSWQVCSRTKYLSSGMLILKHCTGLWSGRTPRRELVRDFIAVPSDRLMLSRTGRLCSMS